MKRPLGNWLGLNPLRWWRSARLMRSWLREPAAAGASSPSDRPEFLVVLMPWLATDVPWFFLVFGLLLGGTGRRVRFVLDDMPFDPRQRRARFIVALIRRVLRAHPEAQAVLTLSRFRADAATVAAMRPQVQALAELNAVWAFKGESPAAGRPGYVERAAADLAAAAAAVDALLESQGARVILVPGGVYGSSGVWIQQARRRGVRVASFDSGGAGILTVAADGVACQLSDIPRAFHLLKARRTDAAEHRFIIESALAEMARRRAGTDQFASQVAVAAMGADERYAGGVLVALNSAWDSAALGLHQIFAGSLPWMTETCGLLLERSEAAVIVRQHPAERSARARSSDDYAALLQQRFGHPARLYFIAAADPVNTYELLAQVAAVVVHTSTVGLEAAAGGKPVITSSNPYYADLGFVFRARDAEQYRRLLLDAAGGALTVTAQMREDALYCYYLTQCCNWVSSAFSPEGFDQWSRLSMAQLARDPSVQLTLRCVTEDVPAAFLNHLAAVDRLSSGDGRLDVTAASLH